MACALPRRRVYPAVRSSPKAEVRRRVTEDSYEMEKAPTHDELGPDEWRAVQDSNLWPSAPEADALSS